MPSGGGQGHHARAAQPDPGDRPVGDDHPGLSVLLRDAPDEGGAAPAGAAHRADRTFAAAGAGPGRGAGSAGPGHPGRRGGAARAESRRGARGREADRDRGRPRARLAAGDRRPDRRRGPVRLPRDHGAQFAGRGPAQPGRRARHLLRRVRLGPGRQEHGRARPRHGLAARRRRTAHRPAGQFQLGQRPGAALPSQGRGRRCLHVHGHPADREHGPAAGDAPALRPDQPLDRAPDQTLLHPARGPDRGPRRQAPRDRVQGSGQGRRRPAAEPGRLARHHRQILAGGADPRSGQRPHRDLPRREGGRPGALSGRLPAPGHDDRTWPERRGHRAPVRRRQGGRPARPLRGRVSASPCSTARSISAGSTS